MRVSSAAALCAFLAASSIAFAQTPPARSARPPAVRIDPNSPAQAGRTALYKYLDGIAAKEEAARRETVAKITTRAQAEARQRLVRAKLMALLGGGFEKTPLNPRVTGSTQMDGFRIEKVMFDSQPNFPVTALLYLPSAVGLHRLPAIVMAPGHAASGKAGDYAMASTFARNGFAVLSYDPIGQGERLQYPDPAHPGQSLAHQSTGEHGEAGLQPTLIGDAVARYFVQDGMRAVDYLLTRPEIDPERIGAFGCSGGGDMTAMLGALDPRVHATATACYITSMDALLPSLGPQDAEQSIPGFVAAGLDFADWVELAAPRPYAIVGTVSDMFPWAGLLASATEARRFYSLFNPAAEGTPTGKALPPTPTGPTLNPGTSNAIAPNAPLQVIAGIGGHGNLRPLTEQIVSFFLVNLAHSDAQPVLPPPPAPGTSPFAAPKLPPGTLQITPTGQVATSYPGSATVHTLNLTRAAQKIHPPLHQSALQIRADVREVTKADAVPGHSSAVMNYADELESGGIVSTNPYFQSEPGIGFGVWLNRPASPGRHGAVLFVTDDIPGQSGTPARVDSALREEVKRANDAGEITLVVEPRPSPPGTEETKAPILGPFYMTELRAEIVGKTLLGMRVDDVIRAVDSLASRPDVDANNITAVASGHMGLVLLHAAALDPRLKHITIDHTLESYRSLLDAPMPLDAPQDILPGVLLKYDIPDLVRVLGPRLAASDWLPGTANLAAQ